MFSKGDETLDLNERVFEIKLIKLLFPDVL